MSQGLIDVPGDVPATSTLPQMVTPNGDSQARAEGDRQDPDIGRFLLKENIPLPKADVLKSPIVEDENPARVVAAWIVKLSKASGDGDSFADLFWEYGEFHTMVVFCEAQTSMAARGVARPGRLHVRPSDFYWARSNTVRCKGRLRHHLHV